MTLSVEDCQENTSEEEADHMNHVASLSHEDVREFATVAEFFICHTRSEHGGGEHRDEAFHAIQHAALREAFRGADLTRHGQTANERSEFQSAHHYRKSDGRSCEDEHEQRSARGIVRGPSRGISKTGVRMSAGVKPRLPRDS